MNKLPRRRFLHLAAGAVALPIISRIARAQTAYPTRPVHLIVGFPPGLAPDVQARIVGQGLSERLGLPVIIENRPGAGGNVGTEFVVRAPPDGYTLLLATPSNTVNATLHESLSFNFIRDVAPVASINRGPFVMVLNPSVPTMTVREFIDYVRTNPGRINSASSGVGTPGHICGALLNMMTGIDLVHIPYRGNYMPDLLSGQVQVTFSPIPTVIDHVRAGRLRALGVTTAMRSAELPEVPAIGETVSGYEASGWLGIGAPKGVPTEIVARLNTEIGTVIASPDVKARLVALGVSPTPMTPSDFARFLADETKKWAKVIKFANIKPE